MLETSWTGSSEAKQAEFSCVQYSQPGQRIGADQIFNTELDSMKAGMVNIASSINNKYPLFEAAGSKSLRSHDAV
jgi:hypothetical protein